MRKQGESVYFYDHKSIRVDRCGASEIIIRPRMKILGAVIASCAAVVKGKPGTSLNLCSYVRHPNRTGLLACKNFRSARGEVRCTERYAKHSNQSKLRSYTLIISLFLFLRFFNLPLFSRGYLNRCLALYIDIESLNQFRQSRCTRCLQLLLANLKNKCNFFYCYINI